MVDRDALAAIELKEMTINRCEADEMSVHVGVFRRVGLPLLCSGLVFLSHAFGLFQGLDTHDGNRMQGASSAK